MFRWFLPAVAAGCVATATFSSAIADPTSRSQDDDLQVQGAGAQAGTAPATPSPSATPAAAPPPGTGAPPQAATPSPSATPAAAPPPAARPPLLPATEELASLRSRLDMLEAQIEARNDLLPHLGDANRWTASFDGSPWARAWVRGFVLQGYVQAQYQQSQLSEDQLTQDGVPLNQNRFVVRRSRLRLDRGWQFASATIEVDGNNNNGLAFGIRRAEASLLLRARDPLAPPLAALSVGLTDIPFGYELYESNEARIFLERTTASRAFFPGDTDFAARLGGAVGFLRYAVGILDGTPVPDSYPASAGFDPTSEKDIMGRLGTEARPADGVAVGGGVSFVRGTGFHAGTSATQDSVEWVDLNGNGVIDPGELVGLPGQAATPSKTFGRWALGIDAQLRLRTPFGRGLLYGEAYVGSNYDRGLFVADPVAAGVDIREIGGYAAYVQEITPYAVVGLRVDAYDPNDDATTQRAGTLLPLSQTITTVSPLVGAVWPGRARLVFEYDRVRNHEGLTPSGVPTNLPSDQWALRLQVEM